MGCSPIIFVGQDLSFTESKSHASDMALQNSDLVRKMVKTDDVIWTEGINGEKVPSTRGLIHVKRHLETMIKQENGEYINSTARGAKIEGTKHIPFQKVIDQFCTTSINTNQNYINYPEESRKRLLTELPQTIKKCNQLFKMLKETQQLLRSLHKTLKKADYKTFDELPPASQKKILKLDKIGKRLDAAIDIWSLLQDITMSGVKESERQKHEAKFLENNYIEWLTKNLQVIKTINNVRIEKLALFRDTIQESIEFLKLETNQDFLIVLDLYFKAGKIALAQPLLKEAYQLLSNLPLLNYYEGITAAHYTEYDKAEIYFSKAIEGNDFYQDKIQEFRTKQANAYIRYADYFKDRSKAVSKRLLLKGLKYDPGNKKIINMGGGKTC